MQITPMNTFLAILLISIGSGITIGTVAILFYRKNQKKIENKVLTIGKVVDILKEK